MPVAASGSVSHTPKSGGPKGVGKSFIASSDVVSVKNVNTFAILESTLSKEDEIQTTVDLEERAGLGLLGEVHWMTQHCGGSSFKHSVLKLSLAAVAYGIWCERNCGVFRKQRINLRDLIAKIKTDLRACLIT
ncbi:hypothetical protein RHMOL_Rhmol06G0320000 [Rhododendron molle]|uniref:Uncharacterized protein n=1 Tax=Rhododendron molle TaxID=49168 RepID=A0ACC0NKJ8_RHOML|nr:hypothetical protein RHMOL_Rhmol06G0320000 [Rhododendron molle]